MKKNNLNLLLYILVPLLILSSLILMISSVRYDSATSDEPIHILSGYLALSNHDFRFNPEHPFLGKKITALPLLVIKPAIDYGEKYFQVANDFYYDSWQESRQMAQNFLYKMGNNADQILFWCRLMPIILASAFSLFLFFWTKNKFGKIAALAALIFFSFSPNILAHARLANTDLYMTVFFFLSVASFVYYLESPNWRRLILAGICFGLAQSVKFSAVTLYLILPIIYIIKYLLEAKREKIWQFIKNGLLVFLVILVLGYVIIWANYNFSFRNVPIYQESNDKKLYNSNLIRFEPELRFLQPADYWKGLVFVFGSTYGPRPAYLFGHFQQGGWWYYFPVAFMVKTPLPVIILLIFSAIFYVYKRKKLEFKDYIIITPVIIYMLISMTSKLNLGIRHLLPIYPFIFIWIGNFIENLLKSTIKKWIIYLILAILFSWFIFGTIRIYPHFLSYFNEIVGSENGIKVLSESNIDWGQDLKRLKNYLDEQKIYEPIKLIYFWTGMDSPTYYGINYQLLEPNNPNQKGYIAIGVSSLQEESYKWLKTHQPIAQIGYSIYVYKID